MPTDQHLADQVTQFMAGPAQSVELAELLVSNSQLPGPRANLELIDVVANTAAANSELAPVFAAWLEIESGPNDPREFLPATAAVALGAIYPSAEPATRVAITRQLRSAANDARWRVREGVAMGLQRIGEADFPTLIGQLSEWSIDGSLLEQRAIVAALAHPPILKRRDAALNALRMGEQVAMSVVDTPVDRRRTEQFKVLKQGLSYALSVLVAAAPEEGFAMLRRLIETADRDLLAIVRANLGKARLAKAHPNEVAQLTALLHPAG